MGHDIGLMVAFAYAAMYPAETAKEADRKAYAAAYARPGWMRAGWAYFVSFLKAAQDFAELSRVKLTMPVLVIGGQKL